MDLEEQKGNEILRSTVNTMILMVSMSIMMEKKDEKREKFEVRVEMEQLEAVRFFFLLFWSENEANNGRRDWKRVRREK